MSSVLILQRLQNLITLFNNAISSDYIGECVSQYEHAMQAAFFARKHMMKTKELQAQAQQLQLSQAQQSPQSQNETISIEKPQQNRINIENNSVVDTDTDDVADSTTSWTDEEADVIIAALLHDIGHSIVLDPPADFNPYPSLQEPANKFMDGYGAVSHEMIGARYLATLGFSSDVCALVAAHVAVKRYLCATDSSYYAKLSPASRKTLEYQGGPMNDEEIADFNADPLKERKLIVRYCDELAKVEGLQVEGFSYYIPMLVLHIQRNEQKLMSLQSPSTKEHIMEESKEMTTEAM